VRKLLGSGVAAFSHPFLREGAWVRVKHGPLKGVEGLLVRVKSQTRLVLSVICCPIGRHEIDARTSLWFGHQPCPCGCNQRCTPI